MQYRPQRKESEGNIQAVDTLKEKSEPFGPTLRGSGGFVTLWGHFPVIIFVHLSLERK